MTSPYRIPVPDENGRFKDKHLPERLSSDQLDATFSKNGIWIDEDTGKPYFAPGAGQAPLTLGDVESKVWEVGNATYGRPLGASCAVLGDSITAQNSSSAGGTGTPTDRTESRGYFAWANTLLGQRLQWIKASAADWEFGRAGGSTAELTTEGHVAAILARAPHWVIEQSGTNSIQAGVDAATLLNQRAEIWEKLRAVGSRVVICTLLPRDSLTSAQKQELRTHNHLVRTYAGTHRNVVLCDWNAAMCDPATGNVLPGHTSDGTHPNATGASRMGAVLASVLRPLVSERPMFPDLLDARDMLGTKARFVGGTTYATGYAASGVGANASITASKIARTDFIPGELQRLVFADPDFAGASVQANTGAGSIGTIANVGDYVFGMVEFATQPDNWTARSLMLTVDFQPSGGGAVALNTTSAERPALTQPLFRPASGVLLTPTIQIPAGKDYVKLLVTMHGSGTLDLSRASLVRVTQADVNTYGRDAFGLPPA